MKSVPRSFLRLGTLMLVLVSAFWVSAGTTDAASEAALRPDRMKADLNAFWDQRFEELDLEYAAPTLVEFDDVVETDCGEGTAFDAAAFYCAYDETVYFATANYELIAEEAGPYVWALIMAHEWGHHIQFLLDLLDDDREVGDQRRSAVELQADCFAGVYAQDAVARDRFDPGEVLEAMPDFAGAEDRAHGDSEDQAWSVLQGYAHGMTGCGVFISPSFGFRLLWDPVAWEILGEEEDELQLWNGASAVYIAATDAYGDDVATCRDDLGAVLAREPGLDDVDVAMDAGGEERSGSTRRSAWKTYSATQTVGNGATFDLTIYQECQVLVPDESVLLIEQRAAADDFDGQEEARTDLLAGIVVPE